MFYKRILCIIPYIFFIIFGYSQPYPDSTSIDSLNKYSYLILDISVRSPLDFGKLEFANYPYTILGAATGFFIKNNGNLFFCSAAHIFNEMDVYRTPHPIPNQEQYDYLAIICTNANDSAIYYKIDLKNLILNQYLVKCFFEEPDVYAFYIENPENLHVHSIESIINKPLIPKRINKKYKIDSTYYMFGYANIQTALKANNSISDYWNIFAEPDSFRLADKSHQDDPFYPNIDLLNLILLPKAKKGNSGSPVFIKKSFIKRKKRIEWIEFVGVQSGKNDNYNSCYVVKSVELLKKLNH